MSLIYVPPTKTPPTNHPRETILRLAHEAIATHGGAAVARVYFKFTCEACGARCTFDEPNVLYEEGECAACGHRQRVTKAGYLLAVRSPDGD